MKLLQFLSFTILGVSLSLSAAEAASTDIPDRTDTNVIVAAYNIQFFGQRSHDLAKLATVIQHFDVCGIVELKNETAIRDLAAELTALTGHQWGYTFGVRTHRPGGSYHEAFGAVWRRDRVMLGDGVVSGIWDLEEAFRNDPYVVSFRKGNFDFALLLVHTRWTNDDEGTREGEVAMLAEQFVWMEDFVMDGDFILAGDFNYPATASQMDVLADFAGLRHVDPNEPSTFKRDNSDYASPYDHIYISGNTTDLEFSGESGIFDATEHVYGDNSVANMALSKRELSDHLPVWAEFTVPAVDDD